MEGQQQAAELQQAIELEGRRIMGLQLLDLTSRGHHLHSPVGSPMPWAQADGKGCGNGNGNAVDVTGQDSKMNSSSLAMSAPAASATSATGAEGEPEEQQEGCGAGSPNQAVNPGEEEKESVPVTATPNVACGFQESCISVSKEKKLHETQIEQL